MQKLVKTSKYMEEINKQIEENIELSHIHFAGHLLTKVHYTWF